MKKSVLLFFLLLICLRGMSQGTLSGDLMTNINFFQRDTNIRASNNPLYDNALSGGEAWLNLRYNTTSGYTFFLRTDVFNNSNLKNPTATMSDFGVGAWSISKEFNDLSITVGSIYDQLGSGVLFRSYEDRGLLIDNALYGLELKYKLADNIMLKAFTGQQKNNNGVNNIRYAPIIKGFSAEGEFTIGKAQILPGVAALNRTLDANSMNQVVATINSQDLATRFEPRYNMYAFAVYNMFTYKNLSWYVEGDYKTHEAILENNLLVDRPGNLQYTSLNIGMKGIALSLTGKRTQDFVMRTSPNEILLNGMLNRQAVISIQRPQRLMARYTPASQDISEVAGTANLTITPSDVTNVNLTYTHINTLKGEELYREGYAELVYQGQESWIFQVGAQYLRYNIQQYQTRPAPIQTAITPFAEATYRISGNRSISAQVQYMAAQQDYGSWVFAMIEYSIAPKWSFAISDMYNTSPNKGTDNPLYTGTGTPRANHYYNVFGAYTKGAHRFTLAYVKQVDGINCTGGVCRYEPAFSGVKGAITTSF